ncbi:tRNA-binding protein [Sphingobacteriales bacterium UPWRP_1]|nr:tRNA-binding protein [Sphingobacteriales bacterium TSM_CSS]PSJ73984.1 tRNA-binding protein [Sphingobacteriales bacterium UPWRP_1]
MQTNLTIAEFLLTDMRAGRIIAAEPFTKARKPAYKLLIDFGPHIGIKKSSAQITHHYTPESLIGKMVVAVVNFPPRQIADFMSEVLVLGLPDAEGHIVLLQPDADVPPGGRVH